MSGLVTCLALANEMFSVCDVSKAMNQVCDMGMPLVPFRCSCEEFYPKQLLCLQPGLTTDPCRETLRHREEASPAQNLKQNHSKEPGQSTVELQAMNIRINTLCCN